MGSLSVDISYYAIPLIGTGISTVLAILVARKGLRRISNRLFTLILSCIALWGLITFAMRSSPDVEHALIWNRIMFPFGFAIFIFYYHFISVYTHSENRKLIVLAYSLQVLVTVLSLTGLNTSHMTLETYGYAPHFYPTVYFIFVAGAFFQVGVFIKVIKVTRLTTRYEEKNRLRYMMIAIILVVIFGLVDFVPSLPPIGILGNILFGIVTAIALLRYHLLDIRVMVRKGVAYFLLSTAAAIPYVALILILNTAFDQNTPVWANIILLILLALLLQPLWQKLQQFVDRIFYRERYDFLLELDRFSQEAHDIRDLNQLGSSLVKLISRALQTSGVHLLLVSGLGDYVPVSSAGNAIAKLTIKNQSPLVTWLQSHKAILRRQDLEIIQQLQYLTAKERTEIRNLGAELFIALKTKENELVGFLILGNKLSKQPYSDDDIRMITTVVNRAAIELENARLYSIETTMRQELEQQNKQKTEFLHNVAHELKTPLTAIISSSEMITSENMKPTKEQEQRLIDNINRSAWLMNRRVGELLDLAKMQIGSLHLNMEPIDMINVITEISSQLLSIFRNKQQSFELQIPDELPHVEADRDKIEQVLINLLSNANKFSSSGSSISLIAREETDKIIVKVKDSSPAINDEDKIKIFDAYYRAGSEGDRQRIPGLGLGLAISKRIIELHQGNIWIENEDEVGNSFFFALPVPDNKSNLINKNFVLTDMGDKVESIDYRR